MKNENFKVGDTVKLKEGLIGGEVYNGRMFRPAYMRFFGARKIQSIVTDSILLEGKGQWDYSPEMLDLVEESKPEVKPNFLSDLLEIAKENVIMISYSKTYQAWTVQAPFTPLGKSIMVQDANGERAVETFNARFEKGEIQDDGTGIVIKREEEKSAQYVVLDKIYTEDEGQRCFSGTRQQCEEFISNQCTPYGLEIVLDKPLHPALADQFTEIGKDFLRRGTVVSQSSIDEVREVSELQRKLYKEGKVDRNGLPIDDTGGNNG
jgi:hypothetical protein